MANSATTLAKGAMHMSKRLILSYLIDWILIIAIAGIGGGFNKLTNTNKRPFSLQDPSISFPYRGDTVSTSVLIIVSLLAPAVITLIVSFLFIPGPTAHRTTPRALIWRRKVWEWNTAWMGLALALASAFMITEGLKDLAGKPRPHAIAVCNPDVSAESIARYRVGGFGQSFDTTGATPILVDSGICRTPDPHDLRDAFASWPSGHSSFSSAGMLYLTLFLCAKFAVNIPFLSPTADKQQNLSTFDDEPGETSTITKQPNGTTRKADGSLTENGSHHHHHHQHEPGTHMVYPPRNQAAAPPIYLLLLAVFLPIGTAAFICVSRWFDFHHQGIDILSGALIGSFTALFSFRWYHMPLRRGAGWAWGARSRQRAFWLGVGREGYVGNEGWESKAYAMKIAPQHQDDLESGGSNQIGTNAVRTDVTGPGVPDRFDQVHHPQQQQEQHIDQSAGGHKQHDSRLASSDSTMA